MKTQILLTIEHKAPIPDMLDKIAGRAYTLTGVDDVAAANYPSEISLERQKFALAVAESDRNLRILIGDHYKRELL